MRILVAALLCVLLLPACGAQATEPASGVASGADRTDLQAGLDSIVVPQEDIGGLPRGLRLSSDSGWEGNLAEAGGSFDPDDSAESLGEAGRITGYQLIYYDPTHAALRSGSGVDEILNWVELFSSADAASAYLHQPPRAPAAAARDHPTAMATRRPRQPRRMTPAVQLFSG